MMKKKLSTYESYKFASVFQLDFIRDSMFIVQLKIVICFSFCWKLVNEIYLFVWEKLVKRNEAIANKFDFKYG